MKYFAQPALSTLSEPRGLIDFLKRNPTFKKQYIQYQERERKAVENDITSQAHFLHLLANPVRRYSV